MEYSVLKNKIISHIMNDTDVSIDNTVSVEAGNYPRDFGMDTWDWTQGVALFGLYQCRDENEQILPYLENWYNEHISDDILKNINTTCPVYTLSLLDKPEHSTFVEDWKNWVINDLTKTTYNVFQHTTSNNDGSAIQLNDGQVWADTVFMTVLFILEKAIRDNDLELLEIAKYQILMHVELLYNKNDKLFYHGYNFNDNSNFGEVYWLRGNGWMYYGLSFVLELLKGKEDAFYYYIEYIFKNACSSIIEYQNTSGLWNTIIDKVSYVEVSGSALVATAFLKGYKNGILDSKFYDSAVNCLNEICASVLDDGSIDNVSAGTSIGMNEEHYRNIIIKDMPYGKSITLLLINEYFNVEGE